MSGESFKIFAGQATLLENSVQCAFGKFMVKGNDGRELSLSQGHVTSSLADDYEPGLLQESDQLFAGKDRQLRH